jgi:purine-binding chemotaxis protein CheW
MRASEIRWLVVFTLDEQRYALPLAAVERVVQAVEIVPLPKAPQIVLGVVNVRGQILPVVNLRRRFRLPERELRLSDHYLIARTTKRMVALMVDAVSGVLEPGNQAMTTAEQILPDLAYVVGVVKLAEGMVLIHDLDSFLSLEEERTLDEALPDTRN